MPFFYTDSGSFNILEVTGSTILSGSLIVSGATTFGPTGLTGSLLGSSSFATTASAATSITFTPSTASFATTASAATSITFTPTSASFSTTSSAATSITFTPSTASFSTTSSAATSITFIPTTASFASTASFVNTLTTLTASNVQLNSLTDTTSANKVLVLDTTTNRIFTTASVGTGGGSGTGFPFSGSAVITGSLLVSSSATGISLQITGSTNVSGSVTASAGFFGTSSFAVSSSRAVTSSYALTASFVESASFNGYINFTNGLVVTGSTILSGSGLALQVSGSASVRDNFTVNGGTLFVDTTNNRVNMSGSIATTGSLTLLSSSLTINTGSISIRTGSLTVDQLPGQTSGITLRVTGSDQVLYIGNDGQGSSFFKASNTQLRFGLLGDPGFAWNGTDLYPENTDSENLGITSNRWNRLVVNQVTASTVQLNSLTDTTATNKVLVLDTVTNRIFTTASVGTGGGGSGTGFPFSGSAIITGSMIVSASGIQVIGNGITGSLFSGSFFNIIELSMAVSGTIAANGTSTVTLDLNQSNYFSVSASVAGTTTWVVSNAPPTNRAQTFVIEYTNGGIKTNSWFTNTRWPAGVAPTLTSASTAPDLLSFTTDDAGANWRGVLLQRGSA